MTLWQSVKSWFHSRLRLLQGLALLQAILAVQARVVAYSWLLGEAGSGSLPHVYLFQSLPLLVLSFLMMGLVDRVGRALFMLQALLLYAALIGATIAGVGGGLEGLSPAFLLIAETAISSVSALFWLLASDLLSPEEARAHSPSLGVAGAVGAIFGGMQVQLAVQLPLEAQLALMLLPVLAFAALAFHTHRSFLYRVGPRGLRSTEPWSSQVGGAVALIRTTPLVRWMALFTGLITVAGLSVDYAFSRSIEQRYSSQQLAVFLSCVHIGINLLQLGLALSFHRRLFNRLGLIRACSTYPLGAAVLVGLGFLISPYAPTVALKVFDRLENYLILNPGGSVLLSAIARRQRGRASLIYGGLVKPIAVASTGIVLTLPQNTAVLQGLLLLLFIATLFSLLGLRRVYVKCLIDNLHREDPDLVAASIEALGTPEFRSLSPLLLELMHQLRDPVVHEQALLAAGRLGAPCFVPFLLESLRGPHLSLKCAAAASLARFPQPEVKSALLEQLQLEDSVRVKARILSALTRAGLSDGLLEVLEAATRDPDPRVRANAVEAIGLTRDAGAVARLEPLLADPSPRVWANVVVALGQTPTKRARALARLHTRLRVGDRADKLSGLYAAGEVRDLTARPWVEASAASTDPDLRRQGLLALARWGDVEAAARLVPLLTQGGEQARLVARGLGRMSDEVIAAVLAQLGRVTEVDLRAAQAALRSCGVNYPELVGRMELLLQQPRSASSPRLARGFS